MLYMNIFPPCNQITLASELWFWPETLCPRELTDVQYDCLLFPTGKKIKVLQIFPCKINIFGGIFVTIRSVLVSYYEAPKMSSDYCLIFFKLTGFDYLGYDH